MATTAPVLPAENSASISPDFWSWVPTTSEELGRRRNAVAAASAISMRSGAWTTRIAPSSLTRKSLSS